MKKLLIANRGEIACRIIQTAKEMGIATVAVYSAVDRDALHVRRADEAVEIGPAEAALSYLDMERVLGAARASGADAIHPGYGFMSENVDFREAVEDAGLVFVGPPARAIREMGSKARARAIMEEAGVPVIPGYHGENQSTETLKREAERIRYPVLIKAAAGGGGKGMRVVDEPEAFEAGCAAARREAKKAFGDDRLIVERYLQKPRHVEVQILADQHGHVLHLAERECSIQRRHQKVIEEAPAPNLDDDLRRRLGDAAIAAARSIGYTNAGTVEFIVSAEGDFFFLEVNTRLQVEHPVTEEILGLDLVAQQLRVARGEALRFEQSDIVPRGSAIEARIYAEDPGNDFLPASGRLLVYREPRGVGLRVDSGVYSGCAVPVDYDPILAKLTAFGEDREQARQRLALGLDEMVILGIPTNLAFLRQVVRHPAFAAGETNTHFIAEHFDGWSDDPGQPPPEVLAAAAAISQQSPSSRTGPDRAPDPWSGLNGWSRS